MSKHLAAALTIAFMLSPLTARAADKTVVLNVDNAGCELCGPIVKKTLSRIWGVKAVQVAEAKADARMVTVVFDDGATNVAALINATTNEGYPAHVSN